MRSISKFAACISALVMAASVMTAVSVSAEQGSETAAAVTQENSKAEAPNVKLGKVTAVNGSEITVALGEFTKKEKTADDSVVKEKKKTSDETSSADEGQTEDGKKRSKGHKRKGSRNGSFTENGTAVTETVTDSVIVSKKGEETSVSDISEGDLIKLVYNENDELEGIKLMKGHKHGSKSADVSADSRHAKKSSKASVQTAEE